MNYNANTDTSPEKYAEFVAWLSAQTIAALKNAQGSSSALQQALQDYLSTASNANLPLEEIENILGVHESNIMDLAELSEEDEEVVIAAFERFSEM